MKMEDQIMQAAEELFLQKGFNMTSTVEIARKVGCNQALVHYYYRTKENLFILVFMRKVYEFIEVFARIDESNDDFLTKLSRRIDAHFESVLKNPNVPFLIFNDLMLNRERRLLLKARIIEDPYYMSLFANFDRALKAEIAAGRIRPIESIDLILNMMGMDIMVFVTQPIVEDMAVSLPFPIEDFIMHRKEEIKKTLLLSLRPE